MLSTQPATSCHTHTTAGLGAYERHCPETTLPYRTIQEHWATFLADLEAGGGELPAFVLDEFEAYLRCGILVHGLLRVCCKDCGHSRVVAFACKRRGFCPSCLGRRMANTAAFCVDYLFPRVHARQYVLSVPYALRFKMAHSADATSVVLGAFITAINFDLRRRARKRKLCGRLQTGSLTVVQRFGSSLNLNVYFHVIAMDCVYAEQPDGSMLFHPLPAPSDEDIARVARAVRPTIHNSFRDDSRQSVEAPAQVDGLQPHEDFHAVRNHGRPARASRASISSNTSENVARSKPRGTTVRMPSISTDNSVPIGFAVGGGWLGTRTSRAKRTLLDLTSAWAGAADAGVT